MTIASGQLEVAERHRSWHARLLIAFSLLTAAGLSFAQSPLAPVDTSSPQSTLASFLQLTEETGRRYAEFRESPSPATQAALRQVSGQAVRLLDLSEVPPAIRDRVGVETYYLLWDVMARIELPQLDAVPDQDAVADAADTALPINRWRIPDTEITIARIPDGAREGEFLFSAGTVAAANDFYEAVVDLPYLRPTPVEDIYRTYRTATGWMLPPRWVEALPEWANTGVAGQVLWKTVSLLLLLVLAAVAFVLVVRWARRGPPGTSVRAWLRDLSSPLVLIVLAQIVQWLARMQINVAGPVARVPDFLRELAVGIATIWIVWITARMIAERIIATPRIPTQSLHANLIRFGARSVGLLAAIVVLIEAAQRVGIPAYGLVAGAGVGGLAMALAVKTTLENIVGTLTIYADNPFRIGDRCIYGDHRSDGVPRDGIIEAIGLRSTRIRGLDRSVTTIPNGEFANMHIVNLQRRDRRLINRLIGLRYETTPEQLHQVIERIRELVRTDPRAYEADANIALEDLGVSSFDIRVTVYVMAANRREFAAIQEELLFRIVQIVEECGSALAYPSSTVYQACDPGLPGAIDAGT